MGCGLIMPKELVKATNEAAEMLKGNSKLTGVKIIFDRKFVSSREDHIELAQMVSRQINALTMFNINDFRQLEITIKKS